MIKKIFAIFCILLVAAWNVFSAPNICDKGCEKNLEECPEERPYLCERSWWPDKCVTENFGFRECGGTAERYCHECDAGCFSQEELDKHPVYKGDCHPNVPGTQRCKDDEYCCMKTSLIKPNKCISKEKVSEGYDFGCCGGLPSEWEFKEGAIMTANIKNTLPECAGKAYPVKWEVKEKGESIFEDYSSVCWEGDYTKRKLKLDLGESRKLTCSNTKIPSYYKGPHTLRFSWCDGRISKEVEYGEKPSVEPEPLDELIKLRVWLVVAWRGRDGETGFWVEIRKYKSVKGPFDITLTSNIQGYLGSWHREAGSYPREELIGQYFLKVKLRTGVIHRIKATVVDTSSGKTGTAIKYVTARKRWYEEDPQQKFSAPIKSPSDGQVFLKGDTITFKCKAHAGKPWYTYNWSIDGEELKMIYPTKDTEVSFDRGDIPLGKHEIKLEAKASEEYYKDSITIYVAEGGPLGASIIAPGDGQILPEGIPVTFKGEASGGKPPYLYNWISSIDKNIGVIGPTLDTKLNTEVSLDKDDLSIGTHEIKLIVKDSSDPPQTAEDTITIGISTICRDTHPKPKYYPVDTFCRNIWPDATTDCTLFEVCHPALDYIVEDAIDCCDGTPIGGIACEYANANSGGNEKRCKGLYIIKAIGPEAKYMKGYALFKTCCDSYPECCKACVTPCGKCAFTDNFNNYVKGLPCNPSGSREWKSDTDMSKNNCLLGGLPTHATVNILKTGVCYDYSVAVTTLLRKAGYSENEILTAGTKPFDIPVIGHHPGHAYNFVLLPGDSKYHVVDTTGNSDGINNGVMTKPFKFGACIAELPSSVTAPSSIMKDAYCNPSWCSNDRGSIPCPDRTMIIGCD